MEGIGEFVGVKGVWWIKYLQDATRGYDSQWQALSFAGDPARAFLTLYPIAYFYKSSLGLKVLWAAALSEWLNAILKWMMFGNRPYWWVGEKAFGEPELDQFPLTCETGPGIPSGHMMVTCACYCVLVLGFLYERENKQSLRPWIWGLYLIFATLVGLSRLFIATHFPHQVVLGGIIGYFLGRIIYQVDVSQMSVRMCLLGAAFIPVSGIVVYWCLETVGLDPNWSIALAKKWCKNPEWVHEHTTIFFGIVRQSAALLGVGLGIHVLQNMEPDLLSPTRNWGGSQYKDSIYQFLGTAMGLIASHSIEHMVVPDNLPTSLIYVFGFIKIALVTFTVVAVIPLVLQVCLPMVTSRRNHKKS